MSNCIRIPNVELVLRPEHFDHSKLIFKRDLDGNEVKMDGDVAVFIPSGFTTWRELRSFIRDHIAVAAREVGGFILTDVADVSDEYDNFFEKFQMRLCFNADEWVKFAT